MSFTHLNDDECERKIAVKESVGPGNYYVNTPLQCGMCYQPNPSIIAQEGSVSQNTGVDHRFYSGPVDVESDLFNINRVASRCPHEKYNPDCPDCQCSNQGQPCGQGGVAGCGIWFMFTGFALYNLPAVGALTDIAIIVVGFFMSCIGIIVGLGGSS